MKWEYMTLVRGACSNLKFNDWSRDQEEMLNHCAKHGWELISVVSPYQGDIVMYFKRPLKEETNDSNSSNTNSVGN